MLTPEHKAFLPPDAAKRYETACDIADRERHGTLSRTALRDDRRETLYAARDEKTTYLNRAHASRVNPNQNEIARLEAAIAKAEGDLARANADEAEQHKVATTARAVVDVIEEYVRTAYRNGWALKATNTGGQTNG